ncbi:DUF6221 family protein [Micromonospora carbonacea]|uniref:Uncharacterized protein n=1 Tax=Micromonospora carbonacea TaxID=47853 RepID=A0A1C5ACB5_9ACTN|nr:DUF6221 family protein [Micromonospora carbonacea]SCF42843.1 hypothetical protein GA0070563_112140 [Micromonospora carbonacea]
MTATDDLTVWLGGVLDRIEQRAQAAANHGPTWRYSDGNIYPSDTSRHPGPIATGTYGGGLEDAHGEHIAGNDPAHVLHRIAIDRRIIAAHPIGEHGYCTNCWADGGVRSVDAPCPTLRLLAAAHDAEPGYRPEWKP